MKILQTIIILFITISSFAQSNYDDSKISNKTKKAVKKIERVNELMSSAVYSSGMRPKQWDNFETLKETATESELIELTNHPNGVVRSYSFWALSYNKNVDLFKIVKNHLNDDELISTQFGCIGGQEKVGDFYIQVLTPQYVDLDSKKLNEQQFRELDSLLVYSNNNLNAKYGAIQRIESSESNYGKIKELYLEKNDQSALVKLAKYNKVEDIELILNNREKDNSEEGGYFHTYKAISNFPNSKFFPFLKSQLQKTLDNTHYSNEWTQLYRAIASYKNEDAKKQLLIPFTQVEHKNIRKYHLNMIFSALNEFQSNSYDELLWKLWEEENKISPKVFEYLSSLNSNKAFELTKKSMQNPNELDIANFSFDNFEETKSLNEQMLDLIINKDRDFGLQLIRENIKNSNVHNFPLYATKASEIKDKSFVKPLIEILETEWNAHIYLSATKALISYNNQDINKQILNARTKNENLRRDWGGKAFDKLLAENGIE
ncbi:hypothetical protein [uncultured Flavobacterium sp.]|uniref:hypothetical protein n=1 Tax=uncultured Flavobacterium sp. TaxID=165435 RepID=UPI0030C7FDD9